MCGPSCQHVLESIPDRPISFQRLNLVRVVSPVSRFEYEQSQRRKTRELISVALIASSSETLRRSTVAGGPAYENPKHWRG